MSYLNYPCPLLLEGGREYQKKNKRKRRKDEKGRNNRKRSRRRKWRGIIIIIIIIIIKGKIKKFVLNISVIYIARSLRIVICKGGSTETPVRVSTVL